MEGIVIPPKALSERVVEGISTVCGRYLNNTEKTNLLMIEVQHDDEWLHGYSCNHNPFYIKKWLNYFTEFSHRG